MEEYWIASPQVIARAGTRYRGTLNYLIKQYPFGCRVKVRFISIDGEDAHITFPTKVNRIIEHKFISVRPEGYDPELPEPKKIPNGGMRLIRK